MPSRKRIESRKSKRRGRKNKSAKVLAPAKAKKKADKTKPLAVGSGISERQFGNASPRIQERYVITIDDIRGDTSIGDLLVTFPRTRDVLARKGLRLEAEDAGDIYMTLEAFSAMNGLEIQSLVREIVEIAREPSMQQSTQQIISPTIS